MKNPGLKSTSKVCREGLCGDSLYAGGAVRCTAPDVAIYQGQLAVVFERKNVESLRHKGLEDTDVIPFMLRYFGVSRGLEFSKVAFRICDFMRPRGDRIY